MIERSKDPVKDAVVVQTIAAVPLILDVVCRTTRMGFATVVRATEDRWIACAVQDNMDYGLKVGGELPIETTLCNEIRQTGEGIVFDDTPAHPIYKNHPWPRTYGLRSYIGIPIIESDGTFFGALIAIDYSPRQVDNPHIIGMFKLFAELIAVDLYQKSEMDRKDVELDAVQLASELREQCLGVLGHDLRNPLNAIINGAQLLEYNIPPERIPPIGQMIGKSAARIVELADNMLDFTRARFGGGISIDRQRYSTLEPLLQHVVAELEASHHNRQIESQYRFDEPVHVDANRISQMVSNLVGNALTHGDTASPVKLAAGSGHEVLVISVSNGGKAIPEATMAQLFKPFDRGDRKGNREGLGLGLYIASEIAKAHGGRLTVTSDAEETVFRFIMPQSASLMDDDDDEAIANLRGIANRLLNKKPN